MSWIHIPYLPQTAGTSRLALGGEEIVQEASFIRNRQDVRSSHDSVDIEKRLHGTGQAFAEAEDCLVEHEIV